MFNFVQTVDERLTLPWRIVRPSILVTDTGIWLIVRSAPKSNFMVSSVAPVFSWTRHWILGISSAEGVPGPRDTMDCRRGSWSWTVLSRSHCRRKKQYISKRRMTFKEKCYCQFSLKVIIKCFYLKKISVTLSRIFILASSVVDPIYLLQQIRIRSSIKTQHKAGLGSTLIRFLCSQYMTINSK